MSYSPSIGVDTLSEILFFFLNKYHINKKLVRIKCYSLKNSLKDYSKPNLISSSLRHSNIVNIYMCVKFHTVDYK